MICSRFTEACRQKGYSGSQICRTLNRRGVAIGMRAFREAVKDKPNKTPREMLVSEEAWKILREFPPFEDRSGDLARRAREHEISVSELWRVHQASGGHVCNKSTFYSALTSPKMPYQKDIYGEAERLLDKMIAEQSKA